MQVITENKFFQKFDIFNVNNLKEMYEIPAVNKDHTVARIHYLKVTSRIYWQCQQKDPYQHYFHHTYWSNDVQFKDVVPDIDIDLYENYRAQKLTFKYNVQIEAPTQQNTKVKSFLAGLDLRIWWQCKSWIADLMNKITESKPSKIPKPDLSLLLQPVTICIYIYIFSDLFGVQLL